MNTQMYVEVYFIFKLGFLVQIKTTNLNINRDFILTLCSSILIAYICLITGILSTFVSMY